MRRVPIVGLALSAMGIALNAAAAQGAGPSQKAIARVDPCSLLTRDEIQHQVELSLSSGKAERLRSQGVVWSITMQPTPQDASRACNIAWQGTVNGAVASRGEFSVVVTFAGWLTGSVAGMSHPLPIPNLGDEAYFVGGKSGPPYARVGDIAIGIENFPDTKLAKSGLDLLRAAVPRARPQ